MKKIIGIVLLLSSATPALAQQSASEVLLSAIASCAEPNNPLSNGLHALKGNSFGNIKLNVLGDMDEYTEAVVISADINFDPRIDDSRVGTPVRKLGTIDLFIGRWSDGSGSGTTQKCNLSVTKHQ